jgi:hypothetical protein
MRGTTPTESRIMVAMVRPTFGLFSKMIMTIPLANRTKEEVDVIIQNLVDLCNLPNEKTVKRYQPMRGLPWRRNSRYAANITAGT